jgi:hypothetical protein
MITEDITAGAEEVHRVATALSERFKLFELWLGTLKGKIDTIHQAGYFLLRAHRKGKNWILSAQCDGDGNWRPIGECPVAMKMKAIALLPDLLEAMSAEQHRLLTDMNDAISVFDKWADSMGIKATV